MKVITDLRIEVYTLPEGGFKAFVADADSEPDDRGPEIFGSTLKQLRAGIKRRLDKLIVEPKGGK